MGIISSVFKIVLYDSLEVTGVAQSVKALASLSEVAFGRGHATLGRPSTGRNDENIANIKRALDEDRRKTIHEVSEQTNLSWNTVQRMLTEDLHMGRVSAKFVPRLLTYDQRENRLRVCRNLKSEVQKDPNFLKIIVTGDESWCYGYDPESKQTSSQWKTPNSPRPKKARQVHPILRESVRRKRPEMWRKGNWLHHHDNAPAHTALTVRQFLTNNNMVLMLHSPYSPDLDPSDFFFFFFFPRKKKCLKGKRFSDVDDVKENTLTALNNILPQEFQHFSGAAEALGRMH
ncbi:hypothetical protein ANN_19217 [Periplaneta americana]|uniref:Uncharacterized protein n=1 Tax=Periplaneta americana TaxID=6978 RepID=A0ABQ8S9L5_PERAM|nr:hypothetical protein ANN_19217 [Periplaneta americana]